MKTILATVFFLSSILTAYAQQPSKKPVTVQQKSEFSVSVIDPKATQLPPGYKGHDPDKVFSAMNERYKPKGEFETTAAYQARISNGTTAPILGTLTAGNNLFAFQLKSPTIEYDADRELFTIAIQVEEIREGVLLPRVAGKGFSLDGKQLLPTEVYTAVNGLGTKVEVEKTYLGLYSLVVQNLNEWQTENYTPPYLRNSGILSDRKASHIVITVKSSPEIAQATKASLRAIAICGLREPFISDGSYRIKPTTSEPKETFASYHNLHVEVFGIWIYNSKTGVILSRQTPKTK